MSECDGFFFTLLNASKIGTLQKVNLQNSNIAKKNLDYDNVLCSTFHTEVEPIEVELKNRESLLAEVSGTHRCQSFLLITMDIPSDAHALYLFQVKIALFCKT